MIFLRGDFMIPLYENIRKRRIELGLSQQDLAEKLGYKSRSAINKIEMGINDLTQSKIIAFAKALNTTPGELMGLDDKSESIDDKINSAFNVVDNKYLRSIPVYESVSAGFGAYADSRIVEYIPLFIKSDYEAQNTLCVKVIGDSMYPKIEDGDIIQVEKRDSVDSGKIAVVLVDGEEGFVKKVVYGSDWIELHSFNPAYKTMRFTGADVQRISVVGLVKRVIKSFE